MSTTPAQEARKQHMPNDGKAKDIFEGIDEASGIFLLRYKSRRGPNGG